MSTAVEEKTHAESSPSASSGFLACPGFRSGNGASEASAEGTVAHEVADRCLKGGLHASSFVGQKFTADGFTFEVDDDMARSIQEYLDYVRALVSSIPGAELLTEQRLPIDHMTGEAGATGTSDVVILTPDEIIVIDLKFGRGVQVDAEDNSQLQMYASGALNHFEFIYG